MKVEDLLNKIIHEEHIYFLLNPGNGGDCLIALGTFHLLNKKSVTFTTVLRLEDIPDGSVVLLSGGGNFNEIYNDIKNAFVNLKNRSKKIILLPHTVSENKELLSSLGTNVTLFARENVTYKYLLDLKLNAEVFIDHDMAFHIELPKLRKYSFSEMFLDMIRSIMLSSEKVDKTPDLSTPREMIKAVLHTLKLYSRKRSKGLFFRKDVESTRKNIPSRSIDISSSYNLGVKSQEMCEKVVSRMFIAIKMFDQIETDRLHVGIAAALLGSKTSLYPNSYHKIRSVYEYSIKGRYDFINWEE